MCCGRAARTVSLLEVTHNLRADPSSHRNRDSIPDHSVRIRLAADESKSIRNTLEPCVLSDRVRSHAVWKSPIDDQSGTQVFSVVRHTCRCNVTALGITDDGTVSISAGETFEDMVR